MTNSPPHSQSLPRLAVPAETIASFRNEFKAKEQEVVAIAFVMIGIGELISSVLLMVYSNLLFIGGIYLGGMAFLLGCSGFLVRSDHLWMGLVFLVLTCAIISTVLQGLTFGLINDLQACSIYTPNHYSTSCSTTSSYYDCNGDASYYPKAEACASSYQDGRNENTCSCVSSTSSCSSFSGIDSCDHLMDMIPKALLASLMFAIFLGTVSLISVVYRVLYISPITDTSKFMKKEDKNISKDPKLTSETQRDNSLPSFRKDTALPQLTERMNTCDETIHSSNEKHLQPVALELHPPESPSMRIVGEHSKKKQKPFTDLEVDEVSEIDV